MTAHEKPLIKRCSSAAWCNTLATRLDRKNNRGKGLAPFVVMNLDTGKERVVGVTYKTSASDSGVLLNFCPWCGQRVTWARERSKTRAAPKLRKRGRR